MNLIIFGAGGLGGDVLYSLTTSTNYKINNIKFIDDNLKKGSRKYGIEIIGNRGELSNHDTKKTKIIIAVGNSAERLSIYEYVKGLGFSLETLIDKTALVKEQCVIQEGVIVFPNAMVGYNTVISANSFVDSNALIGHFVTIKEHCVISPMACILGDVLVGQGTEVGCSAQIYIGVRVGKWSKIAMGSSVFKDVDSNVTVSGNPARSIRKRIAGWQKKSMIKKVQIDE